MTTSVRSWDGDSEPYDWLHVLLKGAGLMVPPIGGRFGTVVFFWCVGISYIWFVYTWRKSVGVLQMTGSLLLVILACRRAELSDCSSELCRRVPRLCADTLQYPDTIVEVLCLTVLRYYFLPAMATGNSRVGTDKEDSDVEVDEQTPWNTREACVLDSPGVFELDTTYIPDVLGLSSPYPGAAPVRVLLGRTEGSIWVLIPDVKELDRSFHDVTLLDMADAVEPVVHVGDLCLLKRQWPAAVLSSMSQKHSDYEKMRHECKRRFRGVQTGCCSYCEVMMQMDMARHVASYHLEVVSCGGARSRGAPSGRIV